MSIAHVTTFDPHSIRSWSGTGYYIPKSLVATGLELDFIGPLREDNALVLKAKQAWYQYVRGQRHLRWLEPSIIKGYARQVSARLRPDHSAIFSIWTHPIAYIETKLPIVYWADATFAGMAEFYPDWSKLTQATLCNGNDIDRSALNRTVIAIYSSDWAAQSAIQHYGTKPERIRVVPFGANLSHEPTESEIQSCIQQRTQDHTLRLLFIGVEWHRKGADAAVRTAEILNQQNVKTELTIIGCTPPGGVSLPGFVKNIPFLNKHNPDDAKKLFKEFERAQYFILPTIADCTPIVLSEASAFGLPSIVPAVGGIPSIVRQYENGILVSPQAKPEEYAEAILTLRETRDYHDFSLSSFAEFRRRLNWEVAGKAVADILREVA